MNMRNSLPAITLLISTVLPYGVSAQTDQQKIDGTPFISGQAFKKGFFWYDDPKKKAEAELAQQQTPPPSETPAETQKLELNSQWLKENMPSLLKSAMDNPTMENLSRYYTAQRLMLDISTRFSDKSKEYFLKNPMMSEKRRQPVEKVALDSHRVVVEQNQQEVMKTVFERSGLFFFFQSTCQFCHEESQILSFMEKYYSVDILPISLDGMPLHNGLFQNFSVPNAALIEQFKIREVPTIYLVSKDGKSAQRISEGMISAEELKNTILLAARGMNIIDDATFQLTLDIKRQYTIGDSGVLTVDKKTFDEDPYLLQKVMDEKLQDYDMPTADPIHLITGSNISGGGYGQ
ncbi:conjugal transfer protein TraF [Photorhabdus heterorhabditis]|nr:conjugal transfer protein TraF [Photorhabdus heterorhabditis]